MTEPPVCVEFIFVSFIRVITPIVEYLVGVLTEDVVEPSPILASALESFK